MCFYTNQKMDLTGYQKNNNAMTVDKIVPQNGYIEGNIVLCRSIINRAKQNLLYKDFLSLCESVIANKKVITS